MQALFVPNVPCGVESLTQRIHLTLFHHLFLMYRVELKVGEMTGLSGSSTVPNVPCGVESLTDYQEGEAILGFLMYRVELKALPFTSSTHTQKSS